MFAYLNWHRSHADNAPRLSFAPAEVELNAPQHEGLIQDLGDIDGVRAFIINPDAVARTPDMPAEEVCRALEAAFARAGATCK